MFVLPYSPRWLAKQGREEEAKATLIRLHGGAHNARHEVVEAEFAEMLTQISSATLPFPVCDGHCSKPCQSTGRDYAEHTACLGQ
jgi:hypothetical protein